LEFCAGWEKPAGPEGIRFAQWGILLACQRKLPAGPLVREKLMVRESPGAMPRRPIQPRIFRRGGLNRARLRFCSPGEDAKVSRQIFFFSGPWKRKTAQWEKTSPELTATKGPGEIPNRFPRVVKGGGDPLAPGREGKREGAVFPAPAGQAWPVSRGRFSPPPGPSDFVFQ